MINSSKKTVFISFSWTGMDHSVIEPIVTAVDSQLKNLGHKTYLNIDDDDVPKHAAPGFCLQEAFKKLKHCDLVLALKITKDRSEGQLMEIGAAKAWEKPVILCMQYEADENTYLDDNCISDKVIMWNDQEDLLQKLEEAIV